MMQERAIRRILGVFAKYWQPGSVKTRLAQVLGPECASRLYRAFLEATLRRLRSVDAEKWLCFAPPESEAEFAALAGDDWQLHDQGPGDLGWRLQHFFASALREPATRAVAIGSDSPCLPPAIVSQAFDGLDRSPVVLGPAADGGYYLVGLARPEPDLFQGITWSTPQVWPQTVGRLAALGLTFAQLPPWYDVDEHEDLQRLLDELSRETDAELTQLRETLLAVLGTRTNG